MTVIVLRDGVLYLREQADAMNWNQDIFLSSVHVFIQLLIYLAGLCVFLQVDN